MARIFLSLVMFTLTLLLGAQYSRAEIASEKLSFATSADKIQPIEIGARFPDVAIQSTSGETVEFKEVLQNKPTVLIFYRGGWCPYCNTQLGELVTVEGELKSIGFQLIAMSPDRPEKLKESTAKQNLKYQLYSDSKMELASAFGLAFKVDAETVAMYKEKYGIDLEADSGEIHHLLPVPAAFVIDSGGIIRYRYYNADYKVRVKAQELLIEARKHTK